MDFTVGHLAIILIVVLSVVWYFANKAINKTIRVMGHESESVLKKLIDVQKGSIQTDAKVAANEKYIKGVDTNLDVNITDLRKQLTTHTNKFNAVIADIRTLEASTTPKPNVAFANNNISKLYGGILKYESDDASAVDLRSTISYKLTKGKRVLIPTGVFMDIPRGFEGQVRPRSGLALKRGISIVNAPGTIDADYRGEIGVILINHSTKTFEINPGDRIAQLAICKIDQAKFNYVPTKEKLSKTKRGKGGFNSTGVK